MIDWYYGAQIAQYNIPNTVSPAAAWALTQYMLGPWIHAADATASVPTAASDFCSWQTGVQPDMVFRCCSPCRFDALII